MQNVLSWAHDDVSSRTTESGNLVNCICFIMHVCINPSISERDEVQLFACSRPVPR